MNSNEWSKEIFIQKPELVALFDRLARIGRAVQRARARIDQSANEQDNPSQQKRRKFEEQ